MFFLSCEADRLAEKNRIPIRRNAVLIPYII